jgi:tRNA (guanine26-N2/guanine27-N2)-dimethyltransferase
MQLGVVARCAWALGRGVVPLLSFSEGRTFRTAVRLLRPPLVGEDAHLGMLAHCHGCGDQQVQSLLSLRRWAPCGCPTRSKGLTGPALAVSGPLWIGPLQDPPTLAAMAQQADAAAENCSAEGLRLLERLAGDPGATARCWPCGTIARHLRRGPPVLGELVDALRGEGFRACPSGIMAAQLRSDAPWWRILATARRLVEGRRGERGG